MPFLKKKEAIRISQLLTVIIINKKLVCANIL